jgi:hypothetical protein
VAWLKVTDGAWMEPWVVSVGNEAFGLHTRLNSYCAAYLTDGLVPAAIVAMIAGGRDDLLDRLEQVGEIQRRETGSVLMVNYLEHNPSKAKVEADREARAAKGRRAAQARWHPPTDA